LVKKKKGWKVLFAGKPDIRDPTDFLAWFAYGMRQMMSGCDRVAEEHAWAGVTHDLADTRAHFRLVTVHRAAPARRLIGLEHAAVNPVECVVA